MLNRKWSMIGGTMTVLGGILILLTLVDWFSNWAPIWEMLELNFGLGAPEPIIFGALGVLLGIALIRSKDDAIGPVSMVVYFVGVFDLLLTTLFFVKQQYYGIDIPLTQVTKTLLWVGASLVMAGGIEAMIIEPENRKRFFITSGCCVLPLVVFWFALIFLFT